MPSKVELLVEIVAKNAEAKLRELTSWLKKWAIGRLPLILMKHLWSVGSKPRLA